MTQTDNDALADLRDMLEDVDREEDYTVFNHTPEEIGIEVMKNHEAILAALRSTPQPKPLDPPAQDEVEAVARALAKSHGLDFDEVCEAHLDPDDGYCESSTCVAAWMEDFHSAEDARGYLRDDATAAITALRQHQSAEIDALRAENARLAGALETAAIRLSHLSGQIEVGHAISGTLRAEQAMKARYMSDEARAALEGGAK